MPSVAVVRNRADSMLRDAGNALADKESALSDLRERQAAEIQSVRDRHQEQWSAASMDVAIERARFETLREALGLLDSIDAGATSRARRSGGARRGRGMTENWKRWLSRLPVSPATGMPVGEFIDIVHAEEPDMPRNNVRSQLNNLKGRIVEYVDGKWRLIKALDSAASENEDAAEPAASDEEAPDSYAGGASDYNPPQFSLTSRTAA